MTIASNSDSEIFDINSAVEFFRSLQRVRLKLQSHKVKETNDLLILVMGVNHLRDWIAPGFDWKNGIPSTPGEKFGVSIFNLPEFKITNAVCNRSKHMGRLVYRLETEYGTMIDEYPEIDSVTNFDNGPPVGYSVDGRDLLEIIDVVLRYYETNWYERSSKQNVAQLDV